MPKHVAVWMDNKEAHIFQIHSHSADDEQVMATPHGAHHKHPKKGCEEHAHDAKRFFRKIRRSLANAQKILLVGPSTAKLAFLRHVHRHDKELEPRIIGIETVAHPSDDLLVTYARDYFRQSRLLQ